MLLLDSRWPWLVEAKLHRSSGHGYIAFPLFLAWVEEDKDLSIDSPVKSIVRIVFLSMPLSVTLGRITLDIATGDKDLFSLGREEAVPGRLLGSCSKEQIDE